MASLINVKKYKEIRARFEDLCDTFADDIAGGTFVRQVAAVTFKEGLLLARMVETLLPYGPVVEDAKAGKSQASINRQRQSVDEYDQRVRSRLANKQQKDAEFEERVKQRRLEKAAELEDELDNEAIGSDPEPEVEEEEEPARRE